MLNTHKKSILLGCFFLYKYEIYYLTLAKRYSLFIRAMFSREIPLGHSTSQAPVLVQLPNPSSSICLTMLSTRCVASTLPCGNKAYCDTFAPTKSIAEPFLQLATQAPHPIHAAASKALSASCLGTGVALASIVRPEVFTETKPPACWIRSKELRSTTKSLI